MPAALLLIAGSLATHAPAEERQLQIRGLAKRADRLIEAAYLHIQGSNEPGQAIEVRSFLNHKRQSFDISGDHLILTNAADPASVADDAARLGEVVVPAGLSSGILYIHLPAGDRTGSVHLVDDSADSFPPGSLLVLNLAGSDLRLQLESEDFDLADGKVTLIQDPPVGERNLSAMFAFRAVEKDTGEEEAAEEQGEGPEDTEDSVEGSREKPANEDADEGNEAVEAEKKWDQVAAGVWPHPGRKRIFHVATSDASGRFVLLKGFRDIASAK